MNSQIKYINHKDIDAEKWALCIENAENSRMYASIWHLDRTAIVWDALVYGDYKFVMPLPVRSKFGFSYVYQPLFCQQLGIFPEPQTSVTEEFQKALFEKFKYADIHLNSQNHFDRKSLDFELFPRDNFLLDLKYNYKSLARNYSTNTKRNIAKAAKNNLQYIVGIRLEEYLAFKRANLKDKFLNQNMEKLKSLIALGQYKGMGEIYGVYDTENELCAAVYFCRWKNRVIYLNAATSEKGKMLGAMCFLVDNFIQANSERDLKLDFEGSMVPGVARFYSGFGATTETYFQLKFNRLPLPFKWLKRN
jgi:hypothetical protein